MLDFLRRADSLSPSPRTLAISATVFSRAINSSGFNCWSGGRASLAWMRRSTAANSLCSLRVGSFLWWYGIGPFYTDRLRATRRDGRDGLFVTTAALAASRLPHSFNLGVVDVFIRCSFFSKVEGTVDVQPCPSPLVTRESQNCLARP